MKAMVFAAGKGTRLKPLTDNNPKALIEVAGKTLLEHVLLKLRASEVSSVVINTHYLAEKIISFLDKNNNFGLDIHISDESDLLLDTGGGLLKAASFFEPDEDFFIYNVDILSDIGLSDMLEYHRKSKSLASIAVRQRHTSRYFLFSPDMQLQGWQNTATNEMKLAGNIKENLTPLAFSGIHIVNSSIFNHITESGVFSMTPLYLRLAQNHAITGYRHDNSQWYDIGKLNTLSEANSNYRF